MIMNKDSKQWFHIIQTVDKCSYNQAAQTYCDCLAKEQYHTLLVYNTIYRDKKEKESVDSSTWTGMFEGDKPKYKILSNYKYGDDPNKSNIKVEKQMTREEAVTTVMDYLYNPSKDELTITTPHHLIGLFEKLGLLKFNDPKSEGYWKNKNRSKDDKYIFFPHPDGNSKINVSVKLNAVIETLRDYGYHVEKKGNGEETYKYATNVGDKNFLQFIYNRLLQHWHENLNVDYMHTLKRFIDNWNK